jgi:hypothetical protein
MDIILGPCGEASRRVRSPYATSELLIALGRDRLARERGSGLAMSKKCVVCRGWADSAAAYSFA